MLREYRNSSDRPARRLDRGSSALGRTDTLQGDRALDRPGKDHFGRERLLRNQPRSAKCQQIDLYEVELLEVAQPDLSAVASSHRDEPALRKAPLQGHLPSLEAHLVETTRA